MGDLVAASAAASTQVSKPPYEVASPSCGLSHRIKSLSGTGPQGFTGVRAAGQIACAYSGEPSWTAVNCNPDCNHGSCVYGCGATRVLASCTVYPLQGGPARLMARSHPADSRTWMLSPIRRDPWLRLVRPGPGAVSSLRAWREVRYG